MPFVKSALKTGKQAWLWRQYLNANDEKSKQVAKRSLLKSLGEDKGLAMKIGQTLGDSYTDTDFRHVLFESQCPSLPLSEVIPRLEELYDGGMKSTFSHFSDHPATASLGQVHKATLTTGEKVAVKILYPGIREQVQDQASLLQLLPNTGPSKRWGFPIEDYKQTFQDVLQNEVNYTRELFWLSEVHNVFQSHIRIHTPVPYPDFSCDWVLVQSFLEGESLESARGWPEKDRQRAADLLIEFFLTLLIDGRILQTDIHPGNFFFSRDKGALRLAAFDFGACRLISQQMRQGLLQLLVHSAKDSLTNPIALLTQIGFDPEKLKHIDKQCGELVRVFSEPFLSTTRVNLKAYGFFRRAKMILGEDHWWFRSAGSPEFFLIMKAFRGLLGLIEVLGVGVSVASITQEKFANALRQAHQSTVPPCHYEAPNMKSLSQRLYVLVKESGQEKVNLSMPISCVYELHELIGVETLSKIECSGQKVDSFVEDFLSGGARPSTLFEVEYDDKVIKVWAE